jgi:hypothetical protein
MFVTSSVLVWSPDSSWITTVHRSVDDTSDGIATRSCACCRMDTSSNSYSSRPGSDSHDTPPDRPQFDTNNERTRCDTTGPTLQYTVPDPPGLSPAKPGAPHAVVVIVDTFVSACTLMRPPDPAPP